MSSYAKILSLSYNSVVAAKASALKTYWRSVRLIKEAGTVNPLEPSHVTNILLNGKCIDPETRCLYVFYIDTYFGSAWIIEINIDTRVQTVVYYDKYNVIGFDPMYKIYNPRVVHGRLIWTDNKNPIYQMDIARAKESFYHKIGYGQYPQTVEWSRIGSYGIDQIVSNGNGYYKSLVHVNYGHEPKSDSGINWLNLGCLIEDAYYSMDIKNFYFEPVPPKHPPIVVYESDDTRKINNLRQTLFQCAYRYVYMDWRKSTFSPASIVPVPQAEEESATGLANEIISLNNKLRITVNMGGEEVRAVDIIGRSSQDTSKWFLIDTLNKFSEQETGNIISKRMEPVYIPLSFSIMPPTVENISAPAPPVATAYTSLLSTAFTANWTPSVSIGVTGYRIDIATDNTFTDASFVPGYKNKDMALLLLENVAGLISNDLYYYRLRAYDANDLVSINSNIIAVDVVLLPPVAYDPVSRHGQGFTANWWAREGATGYRIDIATDAAFNNIVAAYTNHDVFNLLVEIAVGLTPETDYWYRVRAYNTLGTSGNSNYIKVVTGAKPDTPVADQADEITYNSFKAHWQSAIGAAGYEITVYNKNTFLEADIISPEWKDRFVGTQLWYTVFGLSGNTQYYYKVRSTDGWNLFSSYSGAIGVVTLLAPPVLDPATNPFTTGFTLTWAASNGAEGYYLDVATDALFHNSVPGYNNRNIFNVLIWNITGLNASVLYYCALRAYTNNPIIQVSINSNVVTQRTANPPPPPNATPATDVTLTSFRANWDYSLRAAGYYLVVAGDAGFTQILSGYQGDGLDVGYTNNYVVSSLSGNTRYWYLLRAYDSSRVRSINSNIVSVKTILYPPVAWYATLIYPTLFTANWYASAGASGYYVDVSTSPSFTSYVYQNVDVGSVTAWSVTGLNVNGTYYYRVRAYDASSISGYSSVISATTVAPPTDVVATAATNPVSSGFTANWQQVGTATGYYLYIATDIAFNNLITGYEPKDVVGSGTVFFIVRGLSVSTTYYYRLKAYDQYGLLSGYSNIITAITAASLVPLPPVPLAASAIGAFGFTANWNAAVNATAYYLYVSTDPALGSFISGYGPKTLGAVTSYIITGLTQNTNYYYGLRAANIEGTSAVSSPIINAKTLLPPGPTISLSVSSWNFGGIGYGYVKRIYVTLTNAVSWQVNFPSSPNDYIKLYAWDMAAGWVDLYYEGGVGTSDTLEFRADGLISGYVTTSFSGRNV